MFYVRSPSEGGQEAIAGGLSILWQVRSSNLATRRYCGLLYYINLCLRLYHIRACGLLLAI